MTALDVVMSTVDLSEETIDQLTANSAYGAKILEGLRSRLVERFDGLSRVKVEDVLTLVENEIEAYHHGATREAWTKPKPTLDDYVRAKRAIKDSPQA